MKIITLIYIFFYLIKKSLNYVVYPLKTFDQLDSIEKLLSFDSTYTTLEIGTPPQKVNFYLSLNHYKMFITDIGCKNINLFNITNSKSTKFLGEVQKYDTNNNILLVMDTLYFYDNINLKEKLKIEDFPLYYLMDSKKEKHNLCGDIGLSIIQLETNNEIPEEFEYYLKYLRTQNNYFSFFNYKGEDYIVNSIFLHQEFKDRFYGIKNITWTNSIIRDTSLHWEISMKEIFYNNVHFKGKIIFDLNLLFELIVGSNDYKTKIQNDYFNSYIDNKICSINEVKEYTVFECNANKFTIKDIKNFPTLYMFNSDLNHAFEMNGEELFNKINNKYYFNIVFPVKNTDNNKWIIGKIFFRKYSAIFSPKNRIIGFYIKPNEGLVNDKQKDLEIDSDIYSFSKNIPLYIIIIIVSIIFTILGLCIGKKLFFPKYKKAKELADDDDYEYNNINDNKNAGKKEKNNKKSYTSIEMNCKLDNK